MLFTFDLETHPIQAGVLAPKPVCVGSQGGDAAPDLRTWDDGLPLLLAHLCSDSLIIGHNISFDLGVLVTHAPAALPVVFAAYDAGRVRDTQIRQQLLDIAAGCHGFPRLDGTKGYALADLEAHWLGRSRHAEKKDPNSWRVRYHELDGVPVAEWPAEAAQYVRDDVQGTRAVYDAQAAAHPEIAGELENTRQAFALHLMSLHGLRTDGARVAELKARLLAERAENVQALRAAGLLKPKRLPAADLAAGVQPEFWESNARSPGGRRPMVWSKDLTAIRERVSAAFDGNPPLTEKGGVSTDRDTLLRTGDDVLKILGDASGVDKLLNTYVPFLEAGSRAPVQPRFNILVNSGRTSCRTPNIQNLPRDGSVRECFVPRPGYLYVSVDYDTLELRALAQVCLNLFGYSRMAEALRAGKDLHLEFAAQVLGISYEDAVARKKTPEVKEARQFGKIFNFGKPGGLGITTLIEFARTAYGVQMPEYQARELSETWLHAWPEMSDYFRHINDLVGDGDATIQSFGSGMLRGGVGYCDAANHGFQNLAAQGAKEAVYRVAREAYLDAASPLFGTRPVAFIHDEIVAEVPVATAHDAAMRLAAVMCEAMAQYIPDIPITATPALMERWLKGAEAVFDASGRLVPWRPPTYVKPILNKYHASGTTVGA
jgi:DNA polymerase-1